MASNSKFLVNLVDALATVSHKHVFALAFLGVSLFFAFLMVASYRRSIQPNFRRPGDPGPGYPRVDKRQLGGSNAPLPTAPKNKKS